MTRAFACALMAVSASVDGCAAPAVEFKTIAAATGCTVADVGDWVALAAAAASASPLLSASLLVAFVAVAVPPLALARALANAFAAAAAAAAELDWSAVLVVGALLLVAAGVELAEEFAVVLLGCLDGALAADGGWPLPVVVEGGAELAVAGGEFAAPVACVLAAGVTCWLGCGTLGVFVVGVGGGGAGGISASSREAKGCVSLCWLAADACERCIASIIEELELTSDVILGALGTAALPGDNKRLTCACNRRASFGCQRKAHKFNMLAAWHGRPERVEQRLRGRFCRPRAPPTGA